MFNYLRCDIAEQVSATNVGDVGAKFDAFAVRTHIAF
jgi:phosphate-selective porin OprO/OprP